MKSYILLYDLSILLIINSMYLSSKEICRSDRFFNIIANINSSLGFSIFNKIKFFALDFKSFNSKERYNRGYNFNK